MFKLTPICISILLLFSACSNNAVPLSCETGEFDIILGKAMPEIEHLKSSQIILLFSPFDCSTCLESAFEEIKLMEKDLSSFHPTPIAVLSEPSSIQRRYNYPNYIFFDGEDLIRKSLKFVPTPIFLLCNSNKEIIGYHSPDQKDKTHEIIRAMKTILNN